MILIEDSGLSGSVPRQTGASHSIVYALRHARSSAGFKTLAVPVLRGQVQSSMSMIVLVTAIATVIVVVMMPVAPPIIMTAPIAISPTAVTVIDDRRGRIISRGFINNRWRGCTPAEWI